MMNEIKKALEQFFALSDKIQEDFSARWRAHANRRTSIILAILASTAVIIYVFFVRPPGDFPDGSLMTIPEGASLQQAARILQENHIVRSPVMLRLVVTAMGYQKHVHAGDYLFKEPKNVFAIARAISIGAFGLEPSRIRVLEGATTAEMAEVFGKELQRFDKARFISVAQPLEGYLFPDTYFFLPNATEDTVIKAMRDNFDSHLHSPLDDTSSTTLASLIEKSGVPLKDVVIIASILEREARNLEDRRMIAGVLYNRLKIGMRLQVDVTFLYTIGKGTFQLTDADLASENPYNTYKHKGLPPGPIGSPSLESLVAAVTPTKSKYLYFLADHNGTTHFCADYECQVANKQKYF